jgi:hypothetical protein
MSFLEHVGNFLCALIVIFTAAIVAAIITAIILNPRDANEVPNVRTCADILEVASDEPVEIVKVSVNGKSLKPKPIEMINDRQPTVSITSNKQEDTYPTYEETVLFRIITHEGGTDQTACYLVTQALYNTCKKYNWQLSPLEMAYRYQYASPLEWHSKEAQKAYEDIFINGLVFTEIGNATIFYAPAYCSSSYHESQIFVYETHGIRFFEER